MRYACLPLALLLLSACAEQPVNPDQLWTPRSGHGMVSLHDRLIVTGGMNAYAGGPFYADVWSSDDGLEWEWVPAPALHFSPRWLHGMVVFGDAVWVLGGQSDRFFNDVWRSEDHVSWTLVAESAAWPPRRGHACVAHQDRLYVLGGRNEGDYLNDVWSTRDGQQWELLTGSAPWLYRWHHAAVSFRDRIWVIGGAYDAGPDNPTQGLLQDAWHSADGVSWTEAPKPPFVLKEHRAAVFNNALYVLGGVNVEDRRVNEVWFTRDGENWTRRDPAPAWAPRSLPAVAVQEKRLWIAGGIVEKDADTIADGNDVWYTRDGKNWFAAGDRPDLLTCLGCPGGCGESPEKFQAILGDWLLSATALPSAGSGRRFGAH